MVLPPLYNKCSIKPPDFPQRAAENVEKPGQSGARARSHGVSGAGTRRNPCPGVFHSVPGRKGKTERPGAARGGSPGAFLWESGRRNSPYRSPAIGNERGGSLCRGETHRAGDGIEGIIGNVRPRLEPQGNIHAQLPVEAHQTGGLKGGHPGIGYLRVGFRQAVSLYCTSMRPVSP